MSGLETLNHNSRILAGSYKLANMPHLSKQLHDATILKPHQFLMQPTHSLTWGRSFRQSLMPSLPHITVEDGFLRSVGLGKANTPPLSLIFDDEGIYYDDSKPSRLEKLAETGETSDILELYTKLRLTKYNTESDKPLAIKTHREIVLIVDQVRGDRSLQGLEDDVFLKMVREAKAQYPQALHLLKIHPDVLAGKAKGILANLAKRLELQILEQQISAHALLDVVSHVYTVSSGLGFEALLRGVKVTCFGKPFYAGYGLTECEKPHERRKNTTREVLANAALNQYCHYFDPVFGHKLNAFEGLERLARWREYSLENQTHFHAIGFSRWKQSYTLKMLETPFTTVDFVTLQQCLAATAQSVTPLVWGKKVSDEQAKCLKTHHATLTTMEDGFVRSRGLGSDFLTPLSLVLDKKGIYFDATQDNDFDLLCNNLTLTPAMLERAQNIKNIIISKQISKYNLGKASYLPPKEAYHLVIGQVEDDASIKYGTKDINNNSDLLRRVRHDHPDEYIVYKQHPDVSSGNRKGALHDDAKLYANLIIEDGDMISLLDNAKMLHTMTSLAGFEALIRNVPVTTYGFPFYGHLGLTVDKAKMLKNNKTLTIDELIYCSLISYPKYFDAKTGLSIEIEEAFLLIDEKNIIKNSSMKTNSNIINWIKRTSKYAKKSI